MNKLRLIWTNKHTSASAAAYILAKVGAQLGAVWFPAHAAQFQSTAEIVESAAIGYGLLSAGDASQGLSKAEAEASLAQKPDAPAPPKP